MCKEMPVIPVNKVVDPKKNNRKKWRAEEEERHKGSLTKKSAIRLLNARSDGVKFTTVCCQEPILRVQDPILRS
jgi:hypothetical protein